MLFVSLHIKNNKIRNRGDAYKIINESNEKDRTNDIRT
jgi:hypothetical protein